MSWQNGDNFDSSSEEGAEDYGRSEESLRPEQSTRSEQRLPDSFLQTSSETVSGVLKRLSSIRQLAGDAQVLRRKEHREQNTRRLLIAQLHGLLMEEAEFNAQAVRQHSVLTAMEGIKLTNAELYFFTDEEAAKGLVSGPSVKLRDAIARPNKLTTRLVVDLDVLSHMVTQLSTAQILDIVNKTTEYITFMQTTYQVKTVKDADHKDPVKMKHASSIAVYGKVLLVTDPASHCIWRVFTSRYTAQGNFEFEVFAGCPGKAGFRDGPLNQALFSSPTGIVAVEKTREAFVTDTDNNTIRRIDLYHDCVINLSIQLSPTTPDYITSFEAPKGICVIHGDPAMFYEMQAGQERKTTEFKVWTDAKEFTEEDEDGSDSDSEESEESDSLTRSSQSGSSSFSSSEGSGSKGSEESLSPEGSSSGSGSSSSDGITATDAISAMESAPRKTRTDTDPDMTLEQSLNFERLKKYTVLADVPSLQIQKPQPDSYVAYAASYDFTRPRPDTFESGLKSRPLSRPESRQKAISLPQSRRQSVMDDIKHFPEGDSDEVRLAVTTDHCIWFLNPYTGQIQVIAGHPKQYGYYDAPLGLVSRFSSPKGLVHVRSVLFVADYWNNVLRSVNLYTTQVDTVVDFQPQGPVAVCLTDSGVLYCLDIDHIHYSNMLRIMSTKRGGDAGDSTPAIVEDRLQYQTLFGDQSRGRGHRDSDVSVQSKVTEVWDSVSTKKVQPPQGFEFMEPGQQPGSLDVCPVQSMLDDYLNTNDQFQNILGSKLEEEAQSRKDKLKKKRKNGKRTKKHKKKKRKKRKKNRKGDSQGTASEGEESDTDPMYIDPRLLGEDYNASARNSQMVDINVGMHGSDGERSNSGSPDSLGKVSATDMATTATESGSITSDVQGKMILKPGMSTKKNPTKTGRQSPSAPGDRKDQNTPAGLARPSSRNKGLNSPRDDKDKDGDDDEDFVLRAQAKLFQMSMEPRQPRKSLVKPMTLNDLGVASKVSRSNSLASQQAGSMNGPMQALINQSNQGFRAIAVEQDNVADPNSVGAGSVMVSGGKAFYRAPGAVWSEHKQTSQMRSRRTSLEKQTNEDVLRSTQGRMVGEDEDGAAVTFIDMTVQRQERDDFTAGRSFSDMAEGAEGEETAIAALSRRGSLWGQGPAVGARSNSVQLDPSQMSGLAAKGAGSRRGSVQYEGLQALLDTLETKGTQEMESQSRRNSVLGSIISTSRRGSKLGDDAGAMAAASAIHDRRLSFGARTPQRRLSFSLGATNAEAFAGTRHMSLGNISVGPELALAERATKRRNSLSAALEIVDPGAGGRRKSLGDVSQQSAATNVNTRKSQANVSIMPTLHDHDEEHDSDENSDSEHSSESRDKSKSGSGSDKSKSGSGSGSGSCSKTEKSQEQESGEESRSGSKSEEASSAAESGDDKQRRPTITVTHNGETADAPLEDGGSGQAPSERSSRSEVRSDEQEGSERSRTASGSKAQSNYDPAHNEDECIQDCDAVEKSGRASGASTNSAFSADGLTSSLQESSTEKPPYQSVSCLSTENLVHELETPPPSVMSLKNVPFTRDLNAESIEKLGKFLHGDNGGFESQQKTEEDMPDIMSRRTTGATGGAIKVTTASHLSKTFQTLALPESLSVAQRGNKTGPRKYPNTPLALAWYESGNEWYLFVALLSRPHLLKIIPPKHTKPDKPGRFNALPIDHSQVLLADEASHQIQLLNYQRTTMKHLAGCGKRGHLDGPLDSCRMHSPCSMTLDPRSHFIYIADRGNHVIRKIDLMSGLMSTVVGNGIRGNCDGADPRRQALDSPFEVSWVEPHYLVISCADNAIRSFNLRTQNLETILVGS